MTSEEKQAYLQHALKWGAMAGGILLMIMALGTMTGADGQKLATAGLGHYIVLSSCIYLCQRSMYRKDQSFTFAGLLALGVVCGVGASLFVDLYCAVYIKIIDPSFVDNALGDAQTILEQMDIYSHNQLEESVAIAKKSFLTMFMIANTMIYSFVSLLFALLGAFLSRKKTV
ncbi:MAG: DUF4199 domain-containing protein [Bacteroidales bacterium]|nr:DUF4199 domain-containing protein [Bacteroidales bacterium]